MSNIDFNCYKNLEKINFSEMTDVSLAKWLRTQSMGSQYQLTLAQALSVVKVIRQVYKLGEIRGKAVK